MMNTPYDILNFPIYVTDIDTLRLVDINQPMRERKYAEIGEVCHKAIYNNDKPCIFCPNQQLRNAPRTNGSSIIFEHFNDLDDRWYQMQETLIINQVGQQLKYSVAIDISTLKETQNALVEAHAELSIKSRELERLSVTDTLTGIPNRRKLDEVYAHEVERSKRHDDPLSLLLIDVDRFKSVNDQFGHQTGDSVLIGIANILRNKVRKVDTAGRWGGEEFMVICPATSAQEVAHLAEKLRLAVEEYEFPVVGRRSCSFGVAQYQRGEPPARVIARADTALYRAKENGRNRVEVEG